MILVDQIEKEGCAGFLMMLTCQRQRMRAAGDVEEHDVRLERLASAVPELAAV